MKKSASIAFILAGVVFTTACVNYLSKNTRPEYIQAAEIRVSSYLTSDVGPVTCKTTSMNNERWALECLEGKKGETFAYIVFPAEKAPYDVARTFYLEAANENAKKGAEEGLMQYLQMNTGDQIIHS